MAKNIQTDIIMYFCPCNTLIRFIVNLIHFYVPLLDFHIWL